MIRAFRVLPMLAIVLSFHALSGSAHALDEGSRETVRTLADDAEQDFKKGAFDSALAKFGRAYSLAKVPRLAVWIAQSHEKRGELVSAYEFYRQALSLPPNELWIADFQQRAQKDAERGLAALTPRLAKLTVRVEGAQDAKVSVDKVELPSAALGLARVADPGTRHIVAERGRARAEETIVLAEGEQRVGGDIECSPGPWQANYGDRHNNRGDNPAECHLEAAEDDPQ